MERKEIENYIDKLKSLEKELTDESSEDFSLFGELDSLLSNLNDDILKTQKVSPVKVKLKKLVSNAVLPTYSKDGDAGMDLTITSVMNEDALNISYGFGIAMEIPKGYVGLIFPRSSVRNQQLILSNCVGVIDSGYRGEIQSTFKKTQGFESFKYKVGDRGAQIIIMPYPQIEFVLSDDLSDTERGEGGFGSTGK